MIAQPQPLIEIFAAMPDFRRARGTRHPLPAILSLACCAMVCGYRRYSAIAAWGHNDGAGLARALGFPHHTPCAATFHPVFRCGDHDAIEAQVGAWAERRVGATPAPPAAGQTASALAGKTLRGSRKHGAPGVQVLSALSPHLGLRRAQQAVDLKTKAITAGATVLRPLVLPGRVFTMDALWTQRKVTQTLVDGGGEDVMSVKEPQRQLHSDIALVCTLPPAGDRQDTARSGDSGHGRSAPRQSPMREALVGSSAWPGLAQVFELGRHVITKKTGQERVEVVSGITSLRPERVTPGQVLALVRGPWHMEHQSQWVRDVPFDADGSQVRCGNIPHVLAALRNTAIGLLRGGRLCQHCRRLPPDGGSARTGIGAHWACTGKLNDPGVL